MNEEKLLVSALQELMKSKPGVIRAEVLQGLIDRIVKCDRLLAMVSIQEAAATGVTKKIEEGLRSVSKGDTEAATGRYENAIEHYRNAWRHAVHLRIKVAAQMVNGILRLEFLALPGAKCAIQASTNLTEWVTLGVYTAGADGIVVVDDPKAGKVKAQFYRVLQVP